MVLLSINLMGVPVYQSLCDQILFALLAKRLGIRKAGSTPLTSLSLKSYTLQVFTDLDIITVRQAVFAYCLHHDTPGVGKMSWDDLFNNIAK